MTESNKHHEPARHPEGKSFYSFFATVEEAAAYLDHELQKSFVDAVICSNKWSRDKRTYKRTWRQASIDGLSINPAQHPYCVTGIDYSTMPLRMSSNMFHYYYSKRDYATMNRVVSLYDAYRSHEKYMKTIDDSSSLIYKDAERYLNYIHSRMIHYVSEFLSNSGMTHVDPEDYNFRRDVEDMRAVLYHESRRNVAPNNNL